MATDQWRPHSPQKITLFRVSLSRTTVHVQLKNYQYMHPKSIPPVFTGGLLAATREMLHAPNYCLRRSHVDELMRRTIVYEDPTFDELMCRALHIHIMIIRSATKVIDIRSQRGRGPYQCSGPSSEKGSATLNQSGPRCAVSTA